MLTLISRIFTRCAAAQAAPAAPAVTPTVVFEFIELRPYVAEGFEFIETVTTRVELAR